MADKKKRFNVYTISGLVLLAIGFAINEYCFRYGLYRISSISLSVSLSAAFFLNALNYYTQEDSSKWISYIIGISSFIIFFKGISTYISLGS